MFYLRQHRGCLGNVGVISIVGTHEIKISNNILLHFFSNHVDLLYPNYELKGVNKSIDNDFKILTIATCYPVYSYCSLLRSVEKYDITELCW